MGTNRFFTACKIAPAGVEDNPPPKDYIRPLPVLVISVIALA